MTGPAEPRKRPCASCPFRSDVASGIWHPDEYAKLPGYDGEMHEQTNVLPFDCHQSDGSICSGWLGHRDPADMLAVRIGVVRGTITEACMNYSTTVPLFDSGAAAAEHGMRDIENPSPRAIAAMSKITRRREAVR